MFFVGFRRDNSFRSRLIRFVTGQAWSHSWVEYPSKVWGGYWAAHSMENGIVKVPALTVHRPQMIRFETKADLSPGMEKCRSFVGRPYDYIGAIWNGALLLLYRCVRWEWLYKIVSRDTSRFTCSEFVAEILRANRLEGASKLDPQLMTPGDMVAFCEGSKDFQVAEEVEYDGESSAPVELSGA